MKNSTPAFESTTCNRCGGTGSYSFNMLHGSRCYGCAGRGWQLTKRGKAASQFFAALLSKPVTELAVGDKIRNDGFSAGSYVQPTTWHEIVEIRHDQPSLAQHLKDGVYVASPNITVVVCKDLTWHCAPSSVIRVAHSGEQKAAKLQQALDYQASLTKAGTPRKTKVAA